MPSTVFRSMVVAMLLLLPGAVSGATMDQEGPMGIGVEQAGAPTPVSILPAFAGEVTTRGTRATCSIANMQGSIAAGYLAWPVPDAGMAVYFDPEGTGASGDPGCGANPYSYLIEDVDLTFADASMFTGGESGPGTLEFSVAINCPNDDGDPCSMPGTELFRSDTITMTVPPEGELREFNVAIDVCVDGPFFVIVHYETWSGDADKVPSLLWDDVTRPRCRQYITGDGGTSWTDHEDYFTSGDTGWALITVNGNTQDTCGPSGNCGGPPPEGACCNPDGSCDNFLTPAECDAQGGEWQGADTLCFAVDCPQPPLGACCDAEAMCTEADEFECTGTWLGADTACGGDCDDDGSADICVLALGLDEDCQPNGVPDECDIADGASADINFNGVPDECECRAGNGDINGDLVIDFTDYVAFAGCMTGPQTAYEAGCEKMDMDGDCDVDLGDFQAFQGSWGDIDPGIVYAVQLAGNSLAEYPYFEYVKAFNEDSTVEVALDPTMYPEALGRTCDIYVVDAKSAGGWSVDPSLTDVTADGPETVTVSGTTIQENTWTVTGPFELDADAGIGLGVGYDVVLDCNRDGELTGGDYIDGLSNEAGMYAVHDTTAPGPLAVTEIASYNVGTVFGIPTGYTLEDIYYPTSIASLGELPMIVISHGNGHNYQWYDHIGYHMASYGYVVMSHQNNTGPGIDQCSLTTCGHTDAFIDQLDTIGGGVLDGHVDTHRITWIGHSRGAEGVAMAFDRIAVSHTYTPTLYSPDDIVLISSMLPVDFYGGGYTSGVSNPHWVNYHLWTASGDADVSGVPSSDVAQTFHLHDRATGYRHSTVVQGTGHAWFHDGPESPSYFDGPCPIGQTATHQIQVGMFLPLIKYYVEGNIPATDFFWRQWESFRPIGAPDPGFCSASGGDAVVVSNTYRNGSLDGKFIIDDFQSESSTGVSSSGGAVTFTVSNLTEGRLDDGDTSFTWTASDPMNGFTYGASTRPDNTRGVVFDWNGGDHYMEWEIVPDERDFSNDLYLSFRAGQGTRHPYTIAELGDLTFDVTLRDGSGATSTINVGAYGGGIEEPYQRTGSGTGAGWGVEFETIRMRLTDFLHNGSGLDLTSVVAIRFEFGSAHGATQGRIGVDDLELTNDLPAAFLPMTMSVLTPIPEYMSAIDPTEIDVAIFVGDDTLVPGSPTVHYRYSGGAYTSVAMTDLGGDVYRATLPSPACSDTPEYYFTAQGAVTGLVSAPESGPAAPFTSSVGEVIIALDDDFETDQGWTVVSIDLSGGEWDRGSPVGDGSRGDPTEDYDGSGQCYLTENVAGNSDVDGGPTIVTSPTMDLTAMSDPLFRYARWWANDDQDSDPFDVEVSNDDGANWILVERVVNIPSGWVAREVHLTDYITLTDQVKVRFSCMDNPNNSIDEGGVDAVKVFEVECE